MKLLFEDLARHEPHDDQSTGPKDNLAAKGVVWNNFLIRPGR